MTNSVLRTKCGNWVYGRCAKIKRVTAGWQHVLFAQDVKELWKER